MAGLKSNQIVDSENVDPRRKDLYRIGGIACIGFPALTAFAIIAYFIWP